MHNGEEEGYFCLCLGYFSLALAQLALVVLASAVHNDITPADIAVPPEQRSEYKRYQLATELIGGLSLLLIIVEFYISIVWLAFAQLMTTAYYLYLPLGFLNKVEDDGWFMADEAASEDSEEGSFFDEIEPAFSNRQNRISMYGSLEFSQMPGPGAASPI
ncbi:hypothetical protein F53441_11959 [Fusarium austroafricanum]|uniref:Uncharacterized protein n=1 Tax=Fusarium austroafricanum TaxID=2364996 RepID=A0A8H4K360_9HYPO|nr:hypothetical protein F53441_11959 [Fusarium austroafricanum]